MAVPEPVAGLTHDLVLVKGTPGNETVQGLMVAGGMKHYSCQPYTPFAPTAREGEATNRDLALPAVWELQQDWSGGVGKFVERKTEDNGYSLSIANSAPDSTVNAETGATLFTGLAGCIMPAPALTNAGTISNAQQFIEFKSAYYFVTSDSTRKLYKYDITGVTPSEVTLPAGADWTGAATQLYTDGASLYIAQGASKNVLTSTDAITWVQYQVGGSPVNANFLCVRDDGALAYVAGATLTPGAGVAGTQAYTATTVGWTGTPATNMVFFKGALWIGKPEGLYSWYEGKVDKRFDAGENYSGTNFAKMCVHNSLLYFNVRNQLYYTDGNNYTQIFPNDAGGFANISCLFPTSGPLLLGGKLLTAGGGQAPSYPCGTAVDDATVGTVAWSDPSNATGLENDTYATAALGTAIGPLSGGAPTTDSAVFGEVAWSNPGNAQTSNDSYATATLMIFPTLSVTTYLKSVGYSFTVPAGATVVGVKVEAECKSGNAATPSTLYAKLVKGGVVQAAARAIAVPTSESYVALGSPSDLWGTSLAPADANAATFGVVLYAILGPGSASDTVSIDHIRITVYYQTSPATSHYLKCTDFGISLPTDAVPEGVIVVVHSERGYCNTFDTKLVKGGVISGDTKSATYPRWFEATLPDRLRTPRPAPTSYWEDQEESPILQATEIIAGTDYAFGFGGNKDLWNISPTLTRADVVASDFGVAVSARGPTGIARIDAVEIIVFYTMMDRSMEQLYMFWGPDAPGLNPLWSDNDGSHPVLAVGATSLYDATGNRIYFCCNDACFTNKIHYLSMSPRYWPTSFRTGAGYPSCIELTEFSAGFRSIPKWWYQLELNVRDPIATTFAKVEYCVDGGAWRWLEDEHGNTKTFTLSDRIVGGFFPRDLTGVYISLRLYLYTTHATQVAKVTHATLRGLTVPVVRYQFAFPANCDHTVPTLTPIADAGEVVRDFVHHAAGQGYPCRFQDPWGKWHLVKFREPSPMDVITDVEKPNNNARQRLYAAVQCVLVEVDELDSYGNTQSWVPG